MSNEVATVNATEFEVKALAVLAQAKSIAKIEDDDQYQEIDAWVSGLKAYQKELDATFDPSIKQARLTVETLRESKDRHAGPIKEAEVIGKAHLIDYTNRRKAIAAEAQRKAQEAADEVQRQFRKAQQEAQRKAAEEAEKALAIQREAQEADRKAQEAQNNAKNAADRAKAQEASRIAQKQAQEAETVRQATQKAYEAARAIFATPMAPVVAPTVVQELKGRTSYKKVWGGDLEGTTEQERSASLRLLLEAIVAKTAPISLVDISTKEVNDYAKATKGSVPVPGLVFSPKDVASTKS